MVINVNNVQITIFLRMMCVNVILRKPMKLIMGVYKNVGKNMSFYRIVWIAVCFANFISAIVNHVMIQILAQLVMSMHFCIKENALNNVNLELMQSRIMI